MRAGEPSDPYLMTGYDRKSLELSADRDVSVTVEVDFDHQGGWRPYRTFEVGAGGAVKHEFPRGFSAHWVRVTADADCTASATFTYR